MTTIDEQIIDAVLVESGEKIELNISVLKQCLETLQYLAPKELRGGPEFLDKIYEQKKKLLVAWDAEKKALLEKYERDLSQETDIPNAIYLKLDEDEPDVQPE